MKVPLRSPIFQELTLSQNVGLLELDSIISSPAQGLICNEGSSPRASEDQVFTGGLGFNGNLLDLGTLQGGKWPISSAGVC